MKNTWAVPGLLLAALGSAEAYDLKGVISGYMTGPDGACNIAIDGPANGIYNNGYHRVSDARTCNFARAIYALRGEAVRARTKVTPGRDGPNEITELEASRGGASYWPPYRDGNAADHYGLIGSVNGYLRVANNKSCFVSIKSSAFHGNAYHEVKDRAKCRALLYAYADGSENVAVHVERGEGMNRITEVDLTQSDGPRWYGSEQ